MLLAGRESRLQALAGCSHFDFAFLSEPLWIPGESQRAGLRKPSRTTAGRNITMKNSLFTGLIESGFISCRSGTSVFQMFFLDARGKQHALGCTFATVASVVTEWDCGFLALQPSRHVQNRTQLPHWFHLPP